MTDTLIAIVALTLSAGTPLVLAGLGELVTEKSGVLNLGVEGMMLVGAVIAVIATLASGNPWLGIVAGGLAGTGMALLFAVVALSLQANQVATGLALTILGVGLSAFIGRPYEGTALGELAPGALAFGGLSELPVLGPILFSQNLMVYLSMLAFAAVAWFLYKTKPGLALRAIGDAPASANAIGYRVIRIRYLATAFGGFMAGLGGAYLSVIYTPGWVEGMVAGRGWIALALVVFATWRPLRVLLGAWLFGGVTQAQLQAQALGADVPTELMSSLPYLATVIVLVLISRNPDLVRLNAPQSLGRPFQARS
ncbi:MAG: ABC transporter permease [Burkholderiaceae bacterium]